jgi:hypothetical protein
MSDLGGEEFLYWYPGRALAVNDFHADRAMRVAEEINQAGGHRRGRQQSR